MGRLTISILICLLLSCKLYGQVHKIIPGKSFDNVILGETTLKELKRKYKCNYIVKTTSFRLERQRLKHKVLEAESLGISFYLSKFEKKYRVETIEIKMPFTCVKLFDVIQCLGEEVSEEFSKLLKDLSYDKELKNYESPDRKIVIEMESARKIKSISINYKWE